jgi:uncharacterized membrane protein
MFGSLFGQIRNVLSASLLYDADTKAKSARVAMLTSRLNTLLSVPMLFLMVAQSHNTTWFVIVS